MSTPSSAPKSSPSAATASSSSNAATNTSPSPPWQSTPSRYRINAPPKPRMIPRHNLKLQPEALVQASKSPPEPTKQSYDTLRQNPIFRRKSREWTSIIVGIPVIVATSYVLYNRYQDTLMKRRALGEETGELTARRRRGDLSSLPDRDGSAVGASGTGN